MEEKGVVENIEEKEQPMEVSSKVEEKEEKEKGEEGEKVENVEENKESEKIENQAESEPQNEAKSASDLEDKKEETLGAQQPVGEEKKEVIQVKGLKVHTNQELEEVTQKMFSTVADYLKGELQITNEDYLLLEKLNTAATEKYSKMTEVAQKLVSHMDNLQQKCEFD